MIPIEQIKEYTKCPQFGDKDYGKWGALRLEQRKAYRDLIDIIEGMEQKIERLNNITKELEKYIEESYKYNSKCLSTIFEARAFEDNKILDKLQELKGSDK